MIGAHNSDIDLAFYNDKVKEIIAADLIAEPFTYVPIVAGHMELVGGNAIVFGKITEGYDTVVLDVEVEITYENISLQNARINLNVEPTLISISEYTTDEGTPDAKVYRSITAALAVHIPDILYIGSYYNISIFGRVAAYKAQVGDTITQIKAGLEAALVAQSVDVYANLDPNVVLFYSTTNSYEDSPVYQQGDVFTPYIGLVYSAYITSLGYATEYPQLKRGAVHSFGVVYKDRGGRTCSVIKDNVLDVYIPFYPETVGDGNLLSSIVKLVFKLRNRPPAWAVSFEIVYFDNISMDYFLQISANNITSIGNNRYSLNIQDTFDYTRNKNNRWKLPVYVWETGDRLRLLGTTYYGGAIGADFISDYEIEGTGTQYGDIIGGDWLIFQAVNHPAIFGNVTSVLKINTDLNGAVFNTRPNVMGDTPVARIDIITLSGTSGTAMITVGNLSKIATFNGTIGQTATDFVNAYATAYFNIGIVLTQGIGGSQANLIFTANIAGVDFPGQSNVLVEIYRPQKGFGSIVAYGTGLVFDIATDAYGNKYHKGDIDQAFDASGMLTTPASINNFSSEGYSIAADCWKFMRLNYLYQASDIEPFWAESIFPSDWWGNQIISNKLTSMGFPFLDDLSQKQTVLNQRFRNGGFLIPGTRTNNIAHFVFNDFRDLPEKDGDIEGLREVGYTLKVIQKYKETSVYINRVQTFNPDGTSQFTLTDTFIGNMRPMEDDWGCQHPDSIMVNGRNVYYWDDSQGALIRSAPNGQQVISGPEYKMSRYFKDIVRWIQLSGGSEVLQVRIGANNEHKEVWITFRMYDDVRGLIFSEKQDRFTSRIDQMTESYIHLGNFFAHLYEQRIWIMNIDEGQGYLSWSGTPTIAEVEVVSNVEPLKNKIFNAVASFCDHLLTSLARFVRIPTEASGSNELMETNIPVWERREGVYFGQIMKDLNSKGNFSSDFDRKLNGRAMRGRYCFVRLHTEEHTEKVRIDSIVIFSTPSERNI